MLDIEQIDTTHMNIDEIQEHINELVYTRHRLTELINELRNTVRVKEGEMDYYEAVGY